MEDRIIEWALVTLITADNRVVDRVEVVAMEPMPDILSWRGRYFLREGDRLYKEGFCVAVRIPPFQHEIVQG